MQLRNGSRGKFDQLWCSPDLSSSKGGSRPGAGSSLVSPFQIVSSVKLAEIKEARCSWMSAKISSVEVDWNAGILWSVFQECGGSVMANSVIREGWEAGGLNAQGVRRR